MTKTVGVIDFQKEAWKLVREYGDEVRAELPELTKESADIACKYIRANSKKSKGKKGGAYAKDWAVKEVHARLLGTSYVVYNRKHYRVAHLLERNHTIANRYGSYGEYTGDHVIADAETLCIGWLESEISKRIGGS